ncbi:MAG TPA: hypothetical protein VES66_04825 [Terriglobales bacterium]|nr:hypothetical protein [Terriglobales bacterium]
MRRLVACFLLSSLVCAFVCGCGAVRIQGFVGSDVVSVSGFVSAVQVTTVAGANGTLIEVTFVTLQQTLGFTTTNFCGNVSARFPMNSFAQVSFKPGQPCSTIVVIIIN